MKKFIKSYKDIITVPNILLAWEEFLPEKRKRDDVVIFQSRLLDNALNLYHDLKNKTYIHGEYKAGHTQKYQISNYKYCDIMKNIK